MRPLLKLVFDKLIITYVEKGRLHISTIFIFLIKSIILNKKALILLAVSAIVSIALAAFLILPSNTLSSVKADNNQPGNIDLKPIKYEDSLRIKGLSFVAPPRPFSSDPMPYITSINAEWIAVIPYGFIAGGGHVVQYGSNRQWWGEKEIGVRKTIAKAKENGLKVMLKPQIWMSGNWIGDFDLDDDEKWAEWEKSYSAYLLLYAKIAEETGVEMLCIGTEFKKAMQTNTPYWYRLIDEVREVYRGPLTYSSNWDEYKDVPIWDKLDYIGISAYFPLTEKKQPSHPELRKQWQPVVKELRNFSRKEGKRIIFTEFGYLSMDGCAGKTWILEKEREKHAANQQAQADAFHCLFDTFWEEDWWAGGFFWKWYPEMRPGRKNFYAKDYSPQGKIAEETITEWYGKS